LILQEVAYRIKNLRGACSQNEFAEKLRVSQNYMSQMENAKVKPSIETLFSISALCDVSIDYILTGKNYTSAGVAENQSFVGMEEIADTPLARSMFQTLNQISIRVNTIADGVQRFDRIGSQLSNLKALEGTTSALSISPETSESLKAVKSEMVQSL